MATGCDQFNQTRLHLSLFSGGLKKNIRSFKEVRLRGDPFWETLDGHDDADYGSVSNRPGKTKALN